MKRPTSSRREFLRLTTLGGAGLALGGAGLALGVVDASGAFTLPFLRIDPDNKYYWRMPSRRRP